MSIPLVTHTHVWLQWYQSKIIGGGQDKSCLPIYFFIGGNIYEK